MHSQILRNWAPKFQKESKKKNEDFEKVKLVAKKDDGKDPLTLKFKAFVKGDEQEISFPLEIFSPKERKKIVSELLKKKFGINIEII